MPEVLAVLASHSYSASSSNTALLIMRVRRTPLEMISYFLPFLISLPSLNQRTFLKEIKIKPNKCSHFHITKCIFYKPFKYLYKLKFYISIFKNSEKNTLTFSLETSHSNLAVSFSMTSTSWSGLVNSTCGAKANNNFQLAPI